MIEAHKRFNLATHRHCSVAIPAVRWLRHMIKGAAGPSRTWKSAVALDAILRADDRVIKRIREPAGLV
ncbi:MAG: hypothetical protein A2X97_04150 [Bdellovibrionales bacterium GWA1_52_35]|nr:MAG: hypothetical protein A2X97_04150 [Bdellovibrionales bacterium GWA1_52_35]